MQVWDVKDVFVTSVGISAERNPIDGVEENYVNSNDKAKFF